MRAATSTQMGEIEFPDVALDEAFALEVQGSSMEPLYRDGDVLIVCPGANVRKGDRVVVRINAGEILAKELKRRSARSIELHSLNPEQPDRTILAKDIAWVGRVMWLRQ